MELKNGILSCNVWCSDDDHAEKLGLDSGSVWLPISIKLSKVTAIKLCGPHEFLGDDKGSIHIGETHFVVDVPYETLVKLWREN